MVYVQNKNGKVLMPCKPAKAKHLLRVGKAKVVNVCPFTIRLNWNCESNTQEVVAGIDTGARAIGVSATSGSRVLYQGEVRLRTEIASKILRRRAYRRTRRNRKTRYREARFDNRRRPDGWLPPSLRSKATSTMKAVENLANILPVTKVRVEICKFDTQKLQNSDISGVEYQQGKQYQFHNIRNYSN